MRPDWLKVLSKMKQLTWLKPGDRAKTPKHADFDDWEPVAAGPVVDGDRNNDALHPYLWLQRSKPDTLWLGIHERCPPWLFLNAGKTSKSVLAALKHAQPEDGRKRTRHLRCFIGFTRSMAELENRFVLSANIDSFPLRLGTAAAEKVPAPEEQLLIIESEFQARFSASRIVLRGLIDVVPDARLVIGDIAYPPSKYDEAVARVNAHRGLSLPLDLQLDVAAVLSELPIKTEAECHGEVVSGPEPGIFLFALCLMELGNPRRIEAVLKKYENEGEMQARVAKGARAMLLGHAA
jgi:hypothetical protein